MKLAPEIQARQSRGSRRRQRWWLAVAACLVACLAAGAGCRPARPPVDPVKLRYSAPARPRQCPDAHYFRSTVRQGLGYDPWSDRASRTIDAQVREVEDSLVAEIELRDARGKLLGQRTLWAGPGECRTLARAMVFAISLAIDPIRAPERSRIPEPNASPRPAPIVDRPWTVRSPAGRRSSIQRKRSVQLHLGAGPRVSIGITPGASFGALVLAALRWRALSLGVEGHGDLASAAEVPGGKVSVYALGGSLVACGHYRFLLGCGVLSGVALRGRGEGMDHAHGVTLPFLGLGPRLGIELGPSRELRLRFHGEVLLPVVGGRFTDDTRTVQLWESPAVTGSLGLSVGWSLF